MQIPCLKPFELTPSHTQAWNAILRAVPTLASPYFRPEYFTAVGAVCPRVEIAVLEQDGEAVGFLPFERGAWNVARPIGRQMSDFQAAIVRPEVDWKVRDVLAACRLKAWEFDHLLAEQPEWRPHHARVRPSPFLDLSHGYDAYESERQQAGVKSLAQTWRKLKKLEREVGPVRFQWHDSSPAVREQLYAWKSEQYARTGQADLFSHAWPRQVLDQIALAATDDFAGIVSTLHVNDRLAAVHLGMRSTRVLHYWFPAYDRELGKYSPGMILLLKLAQAAAERGMTRLDLGKGDEEYKQSLASGNTLVAEGAVDSRPLSKSLRTGWRSARDWVKASALGESAKTPVRWMRRVRSWLVTR